MTRTTDATPAEAMFAADDASRSLGIELLEHGEGTAVLRMTVTPAMVNGHKIAHGGYLFLFADTAFACACNSHGPVTVAAGADITFVAPAYEGDVLVATAEERTRFGRSGLYDVSVRRINDGPREARSVEGGGGRRAGEVIAEFRGRSRSMRSTTKESR
ncbi:hydroxyphenylacetyl-CoA thioesterase PaaI [Streptomyces sp. NPDC001530]|uniref:hydroxyphenylacetyl-CoA thioesterase PaaI n=1 Tax=Streptomyces sp. NPDC001530 TaxID=3364582 RepID=UPI0036856C84